MTKKLHMTALSETLPDRLMLHVTPGIANFASMTPAPTPTTQRMTLSNTSCRERRCESHVDDRIRVLTVNRAWIRERLRTRDVYACPMGMQ